MQYGQRIREFTPIIEQMLEPHMGVRALHPRIYGQSVWHFSTIHFHLQEAERVMQSLKFPYFQFFKFEK